MMDQSTEEHIKDINYSYFKWRWAQDHPRVAEWQDNEILESILDDEKFYAIRRARKIQTTKKPRISEDGGASLQPRKAPCILGSYVTTEIIGTLLCEIFGSDSPRLDSTWKWARSLHLFADGLEEEIAKLELFSKAVLGNDPSVFKDNRGSDLSLFAFNRTLYIEYKRYLRSITKFRKDSNLPSVDWIPLNISKKRHDGQQLSEQGPFEAGLEVLMHSEYWKEVTTCVEYGIADLKLHPEADLSFLCANPTAKDIGRFSLVFAVAGSGKTQRIFDHLYENFGHYMVSGNAVGNFKSAGQAPNSVILPQRHGASLDTTLIRKHRIAEGSFATDSKTEDMEHNLRSLVLNRLFTLWRFLKEYPELRPPHWLLFQTACYSEGQDSDPFSGTLEILLAMHNPPDFSKIEQELRGLCGEKNDMKVILDEAQCELDAGPSESSTWLEDMIYILNHWIVSPEKDGFVLSGTSLRLEECEKAIESYAGFMRDEGHESRSGQVERLVNFPLITTTELFESLFVHHIKRFMDCITYLSQLPRDTHHSGLVRVLLPHVSNIGKKQLFEDGCYFQQLLQENHAGSTVEDYVGKVRDFFLGTSQPERRELVIERSMILRGRIRWSTIYIEHLLARFLKERNPDRQDPQDSQDTGSGEQAIRNWIIEQSESCQQIIKDSLRNRLQELATSSKPEHIYMLRDLSWTAIRADLMHRSCVLDDERSGQLITEGFAILGTPDGDRGVQQKLAEPLAVKAVIEHLRDSSRYEDILKRLLFDNQDDPSSLGKAAEYYLAWSIGGLLRSERGVPHLAFEARNAVLNILSSAKCISNDGQTRQIDMTNYNLLIHDRPDDAHLGKQIPFHEWLSRVRQSEPFPAMYFPSTYAGPDIVFMMKSNDREDFILCAIQLKTAVRCNKDDATAVLRTVEPNLWFSKGKKLRTAFREEIERWTNLQILTLLFTTSSSCNDYWKFDLEGCGNDVTGPMILERVLQDIADKDKELATEEEGKVTMAAVYKEITGKPWREKPKSATKGSSQEQTGQDQAVTQTSPTESIDMDPKSPSQSRKRAASAPPASSPPPSKRIRAGDTERIDFHFAVLDSSHTPLFFGQNVMRLIEVIKNWKAAEAEDDDDLLELPDPVAQAKLNRYTVNKVLKPLCEFVSVPGYKSMRNKKQLVDALARVPDILTRLAEFLGQRADNDGGSKLALR